MRFLKGLSMFFAFVPFSVFANDLNARLVDAVLIAKNDAEAATSVASLLAKGASPNAKNDEGEPVIFVAVRNLDLKTVKALLQKKASLEEVEATAPTTIFALAAYAACLEPKNPASLEIIEALIKAGASVKPSRHGATALHQAVINCEEDADSMKILEALIKHKVDVNSGASPNPAKIPGKTPPMRAAEQNKAKIIAFLVKSGANIQQKGFGKTALTYAKEHKANEAIKALSKAGARD